jgi:hypothetical protein
MGRSIRPCSIYQSFASARSPHSIVEDDNRVTFGHVAAKTGSSVAVSLPAQDSGTYDLEAD